MDESDRRRLTCSVIPLTDDLSVRDIVPYLIQDQIFTLDNDEEIKAEKTNKDKVLKFIKLLTSKGPGAYSSFCQALKSTGQGHLLDVLEQCDVADKGSVDQNCPVQDSELSTLQAELKDYYCRHLRWLSPIPWSDVTQLGLDSVFTAPQLLANSHRAQSTRTDNGTYVGISDLFAKAGGKVLVEGEPGMGKTTLCSKLAYDWANGQGVSKFSLLVLVKARDLDDSKCTLGKILLQHLLPEDTSLSEQDITKCLQQQQEHLVFIIDGFDEMQHKHEQIMKLLEGKILRKSSILVTSRSAVMTSHIKYFDSVLLNIGYSTIQQIEFVSKFFNALLGEDFQQDSFDTFVSKLENDELVKDLCRNPLTLSILCMLQCELGGEIPVTYTQLYQQMHDFIMKRACSKIELTEEKLVSKCSPLYKIAYRGLLDGRYEVSHEEVNPHIDVDLVQKTSFFTKKVRVRHFKQTVHYSFTHKSFLEYFAAVYIASKQGGNWKEYFNAIQSKSACQVIALFLCGLLHSDSQALVELLSLINEETYLPWQPDFTIGVQHILENHSSHLALRCFSQITSEPLSPNIVDCVEMEHVCFSLLWCMEGCVDGLIRYLDILDKACSCKDGNCHRKVRVTIQMQCLEKRKALYQKLLNKLCTSRHAFSLHIHQIITHSQLACLFEMLSEAKGRIDSLELHFLNIDHTEICETKLKPFTSFLSHVKRLAVQECLSTPVIRQLLSLLKSNRNLEGLSLSSCTLDESAFLQLCSTLSCLSNLKCFHFTDNSVDFQDPCEYANMLEALSLLPVQQLSLSHLPSKRMVERRESIVAISGESAVFVPPSLTKSLHSHHISYLDLSNTYLGSSLLTSMASAIGANTTLKVLKLVNNHVVAFDALDSMLMALQMLPCLEMLHLWGTELNESNYATIVKLLGVSSSLKSLSIPAWLGSLDKLADGLLHNSSLESLIIHRLQFHHIPVKPFADAIRQHPSLKELSMKSNRAPPLDMMHLLAACAESCSLKALSFVNFGLDHSHIENISSMLQDNTNINTLDLRGNNLKGEDLPVLHQCLANRPKLKYLNMSQSHVLNWHPVVEKLRERVVVLKTDWF